MTFGEALTAQWFEVVDQWTDARGARECIIFAGPLQSCGEHVESLGDYGYNLIIRPVSF